MTEIIIDSKAKPIYTKVLNSTVSASKEKVKEIFENQARLDGNSTLSKEGAKLVANILRYYDEVTSFQIGIYNAKEVDQVQDETSAVIKAQKLFDQAFDVENAASTLRKKDLQIFIDETAKAGLQHPKLIEIARRLNPDLNPEDHILIFEYENTESPKEKEEITKKITDRIKFLTEKEFQEYNGIVSPYKSAAIKRLDAFWYALNSIINGNEAAVDQYLGEFNLEVTMKYAKALKDTSFLVSSDVNAKQKKKFLAKIKQLLKYKKSGSEKYQKAKEGILKNKKVMLSLVEDAYFAMSTAPLGSKAKIKAYRRCRLLYDVALVSGIRAKEISSRVYTTGMPEIDLSNDYSILADLEETVSSPEKVDDYIMQGKVLDQICFVSSDLSVVRDKFFANPNTYSQLVFYSTETLLMTYIGFAQELGCSIDQIRGALEEGGALEPPEPNSTFSLNKLKVKGAVRILPKDLPIEVVEILEKIGVYKDICKDVKSINFAKQIEDPMANRLVGEASGVAMPLLQSIWIDGIDVDGSEMEPYIIASIIVHEWLHVKWGIENFDNMELLRSIPNERNSFLGEAQFMQVYLKKLIFENADQINKFQILISDINDAASSNDYEGYSKVLKEIQKMEKGIIGDIYNLAYSIFVSKQIGLAANKYLGYAKDNISPSKELPKNSDELDLDTYPSNLSESQMDDSKIQEGIGEILKECGYPVD